MAMAMLVSTFAAPASATTNLSGSTGSLIQVVVPDATTTGIGAVPASPSGLGVAVVYPVTVTAVNGVTTFATGTVTVKDGTTALCNAAPIANTAIPGVSNMTCTEPGLSMLGGLEAENSSPSR
jgi:hypothetical protein